MLPLDLGGFMRYLLCALMLAGCTAAVPGSPTTAPRPDLPSVDAKAKSALVAHETFDDIGAKFSKQTPEPPQAGHVDGRITEVCGGQKTERGEATRHHRTWTGRVFLVQEVYGLTELSGRDVVESVRTKARSCKTYVGKQGKPEREVRADVTVREPAGVDGFYTYCQTLPDAAAGTWSCNAFIAYDNLVTVVIAVGVGEAQRLEHLSSAVPRVADQLLKAR